MPANESSQARAVADDASIPPCFPLRFFVDFLKHLHERRDEIEIITYADLPWEDDFDYEHNYPNEFKRWNDRIRKGKLDARKMYVLLQHDVDAAPHRTHAVLNEEERCDVRSNIMIFNRRLNRRRLLTTGELEQREYAIDDELLRRLQTKGFVIGYHSNAYEWSQFDMRKAAEIFERDVAQLQQRFRIEYFCPHGGVRDAHGRSNAALDVPKTLRQSLRWVLNGHTVRFHGTYSDGGMNAPQLNTAEKDLRAFVRTWQPGKRYRILTHPQYYDHTFTPLPRLAGVAWYEEMVRTSSATPASPRSYWQQ